MKKILALFISLFYLFSLNACYAFSEMYYINSSNQTLLKDEVENLFVKKSYTVTKTNPYYAVSNKKSDNYIIVQIVPYGSQSLFYYETNKNKSFNKEFLKYCANNDITYTKSTDSVSLSKISEMTQESLSGTTRTYDFNYNPNVTRVSVASQAQKVQTPSTTLKGFVGKVGKGTTLDVYLQNAINTATANIGDTVVGVLKSDWRVNSYVIAPQGSVLTGMLTKANSARAGMRNGSVQIDFNRLETPEGKVYNLTTEKIDFDVTNEGHAQKVVTSVATAAAVGALVGLAFALLGSNGNYGTNAAIGAGIAGGGALLTQAIQAGVDAEIPSYTDLEVKLLDDINVVISY